MITGGAVHKFLILQLQSHNIHLRIMDTFGTFQLSLVERLSSSWRSLYTQNVQLVHFCLSIIGGLSYLGYRRFHYMFKIKFLTLLTVHMYGNR